MGSGAGITVRASVTTIAIVLLALAETGCNQFGLSRSVPSTCNRSPERQFFDGMFGQAKDGMGIDSHFSAILAASGEPSLSCGGNVNEAYRIAVAHPDSTAVIIRVESAENHNVVSLTRVDMKSQRILHQSGQSIGAEAFKRLHDSVDTFDFWSRVPYPSPTAVDHSVILLHAGSWIFEGRVNGWYHAITRGPRPREPQFAGIARQMYALANLEPDAEFKVQR